MRDQPRLYYLDDIPTPYRLGVQRRIAEDWPGAFKLAYCAAGEPGRAWSLDFSGLDIEILLGRQYRPRRQVNPFSFKWNPSVAASLQSFRPDAVVLCGYVHPTMHLAARWCRKNKVPYGVTCETSARNSKTTGLKWQLKQAVAASVAGGMAFGLPVGHEAGDYLQRLGKTSVPMFYFPNTPDTGSIAAAAGRMQDADTEEALRRQLGIPSGTKIVLFVGRMIEAKRPMDALEAFRNAGASAGGGATLVFTGDGPVAAEVTAAAAGDARVVFTGWLADPAQTVALMAISAMLVLPSQHEPWGAVVNEAMAAGTPVIASDRVGAAVELIEPGSNGFLHAVADIRAIAKAIGLLLSDEESRQRIAAAAQKTAFEKGHQYAAANLIGGALAAIRERNDREPQAVRAGAL